MPCCVPFRVLPDRFSSCRAPLVEHIREVAAALDLPLNLEGNPCNRFHSVRRVRARCVAQARALPVLANPGVGGDAGPGHRRGDSNRDSNATAHRATGTHGHTRDCEALTH